MEEYMLQIHEAVTIIYHTYLEQIPDQGKYLKKDGFYHGLQAGLQDALILAVAKLLEREQVSMMFDMLYTLTKKLEVKQPLTIMHPQEWCTSPRAL